ncbi:MAG: hypothetical protein PHS74_10195 [Lachnospiraceae bacterium]|nr:hypothetical protein [Lachnospiraceae bacterium]
MTDPGNTNEIIAAIELFKLEQLRVACLGKANTKIGIMADYSVYI